jgi:WD40 repeat protein
MSILSSLALDTPPAPRELNPQIPAALSDLIMQLLAKKPDERPASAQHVVVRVRALEGGGMPTAVRGHGVETSEGPCPRKAVGMPPRRGRWLVVAVGVLFAGFSLAAYQFGPTIYRFTTNQGQVVVKVADNTDVKLRITQRGDEIKIVDAATGWEVNLQAGEYGIEPADGKNLNISPRRFTLERGGRQLIEVTFWKTAPDDSRKQITPLQPRTDKAVNDAIRQGINAGIEAYRGQQKDRSSEPQVIRTIHSLGRPTGKPLTQDGVTKEGDSWRIEADEPRTVRLFEIPDPAIEKCTVIFRALMKSENLKGRAYLEMLCHFPTLGDFFSRDLEHPIQGTTGWATYETPFFLKKGERPDMIKLNLVIKGKGTVWIKDLKLLRGPLPDMGQGGESPQEAPGDQPPAGNQLEQGVTFNGDAWQIEAKGPRTVQLREAMKPKVYDTPALLVYRAAMKTSNLKGRAYLELLCDFPGKGEFFSKGVHNALQGTTDWTTVTTEFRLRYGERPERFKLRVVIEGKGTVWVKNPELEILHTLNADKADFPGVPQPGGDRTGRRSPKGKGMTMAEFLAKALPVEGESYGVIPAQLGVTTLGDAWRIDADGKRTAEIYEINKPRIPGDGPVSLLYRAEMKLENLTGRTYLEIAGQDLPSQEISVDASNKSTTDWVPCITSFQLKKNQRPGWIKLRVVVEGKGTVWVRGAKLVAIPILQSDKNDAQGSKANNYYNLVQPQFEFGAAREPGDQRVRSARANAVASEIRQFVGHQGEVAAFRFSPDGKMVFSSGKDGVRAWSAATGRLMWQMQGWTALDMDISRDGHQILVGLSTVNDLNKDCATIVLLDAATGKELRRLQVGQEGGCGSVAFVGDGSRYLARLSKHELLLLETDTDRVINRIGSGQWTIDCIAVSPDGNWAVTAGNSGDSMRLWNLKRPGDRSGFEAEHQGAIKAVAYSPDTKRVLSGGVDGTVRLWEVSRGRQIREFKAPNGQNAAVNSVAFSPDGGLAVSGQDDGTVQLWHLRTGNALAQFRASPQSVLSVAFSPDGFSVLSGGADGSARLWQVPPYAR